MGIVPISKKPPFMAANHNDYKFYKYMFIRQGGKAIHQLGDLSRDTYNAELICVSSEDEDSWIGNYAEGFGFYGVKFSKCDCREASEEEIEAWFKDKNQFVY